MTRCHLVLRAVPWYNTHVLNVEQEASVFRRLAFKSALDVGNEFNLGETYKDNKAIRNAITQIYRKVAKNPAKWGVPAETVSIVKDAMAHRSLVRVRTDISREERREEPGTFIERVTSVRNKSWELLDRKLARAAKSNKRMDATSFRDLAVMAGISIDKALLLSGQATEHIAVMGKIDGNINPADAIDLVLRMREKNVAAKQKA